MVTEVYTNPSRGISPYGATENKNYPLRAKKLPFGAIRENNIF